jgi:hypothetical protein
MLTTSRVETHQANTLEAQSHNAIMSRDSIEQDTNKFLPDTEGKAKKLRVIPHDSAVTGQVKRVRVSRT